MSFERAGKGFVGGVMVEMAGIVSSVPQHAPLCSPVADIPSPTRVPMVSLDFGFGLGSGLELRPRVGVGFGLG